MATRTVPEAPTVLICATCFASMASAAMMSMAVGT
eukprot:CAMPEP_0168357086 /NCGR_PEP_ID=MMETSP0228-20121227/403_1 /TAXON_ID=133427 /ORGANISM="Protoceratium reticulatum, Strain CCCM 535 (=CCMP 1889)" /LENGTH=34 /DNA_ID= /DNA_START= /DNA_END= /DNA_ORIENTATION=